MKNKKLIFVMVALIVFTVLTLIMAFIWLNILLPVDPVYLAEDPITLCRATGCSGHICSDQDVITTCEWRPEYACYQNARCEIQETGQCGWTMDDTLRQCLADVNQELF